MFAAIGDPVAPLARGMCIFEPLQGVRVHALALATERSVQLALDLGRKDGRWAEVAHRDRTTEQQSLDGVRWSAA